MSKREILFLLDDMLQFSDDQVVEQLVILNKIEEGLKDIEEGSVFSTDQVKQEIKRWLK